MNAGIYPHHLSSDAVNDDGIAFFTCMDYLISIIILAGADGVGTSLSSHPEMTDKIRFACQLS